MFALYRGLAAGLFVVAVAGLVTPAGDLGAQDKKKEVKKDDPDKKPEMKKEDAKTKKDKDETREKSVGFGTSDGLSLNGYWFQGAALEKQRPDAVIMFPAPGSKITDAWIDLAKTLSAKNFSVLLFDWRGCGLNGTDAGTRIFENREAFWRDTYNLNCFPRDIRKQIDDKGLDWKLISGKSDSRGNRYRDFILNDLMAARFFMDKQNDAGKCNTNRIWIVSEKDGAQLGLAFIAAELGRNSVFDPVGNPGVLGKPYKSAVKDYCGMLALSYAGTNPTASMVYRNALPAIGATDVVKEAREHLETRLAMVLVCGNKSELSAAKSLVALVGSGGTDEQMRKDFKYLREVDLKGKAISGIGMIDPMDSFGAKKVIQEAMVEISKDKQNFGKDPTDRQAAKMTATPRFMIESFNRK